MPIFHLTDTLFINHFNEADAPSLYQLIDKNRAYLKEFLPWLDYSKSVEDSLAFIKKVTKDNEDNHSLTLCIRELDQIIGVITFHAFDRANKCAGMGYWLDSEHQGRGIITLACHQLIQYGFEHLGLSQIKISCATSNRKSIAVPERLGFLRRTFVPQKEWLYDHYVDHFCYEITEEEWMHQKKLNCV